MTHFGIRKLILINSGNYLIANVDLSKPVHLSASNNRGKSTLVNSLQFLYIDDPKKMRFGKRSLDDSLKHYFGEQRSYIIYECQTPTGLQCMLIQGRGSLGGNKYNRFIYDGEFQEADYLDDGRKVADSDVVRRRLADRHLQRVKPSELWGVLAANQASSGGPSLPRLGLLPIKQRSEYRAFCNVFVRLLSLQATDAKALRQLIIDSHASDIIERRIDVAGDYREEFQRVERTESELRFLRGIASVVDRGIDLRQSCTEAVDDLLATAPTARRDADQCVQWLSSYLSTLSGETEKLDLESSRLTNERDEAIDARGTCRERWKSLNASWAQLQSSHKEWTAHSPEIISGMRCNAEHLAVQLADMKRNIADAGKFDLEAMRGSVETLKNDISSLEQLLTKSESMLVAVLKEAGLTKSQIESTFRVANPALLRLTVGESIRVKDQERLRSLIADVSQRIETDWYSDESVDIRLSALPKLNLDDWFDATKLRANLQLKEQTLKAEQKRLEIAEDQAAAKMKLAELQAEWEARSEELRQYDEYVVAWEQRQTLIGNVETAKSELDRLVGRIALLDQGQKANEDRKRKHREEVASVQESNRKLTTALRIFLDEVGRCGLDVQWIDRPGAAQPNDKAEERDPDALQKSAGLLGKRLAQLSKRAKDIEIIRKDIESLEDTILARSRKDTSTPRYFNNREEEWSQLIESRQSLDGLEAAAKNEWDALSTTLGARMNAIATAVRNIKTAVERIKRGLKSYQVSNLLAVEISVEEEHDTYETIEALAGADSLFNDRGAVESAKRRLRTMIEATEVIELESLFELRINVQHKDGSWRRASSLDEIGSTGTGMTVKSMIFIQLVRTIAADLKFRLHFYIDGLGELDDDNLSATAGLAIAKGVMPITADPRLHLEPLAHPEVTAYSLGQDERGKFNIDETRTYHARRMTAPTTSEGDDG